MNEIFKPVEKLPGFEVSNFGRVTRNGMPFTPHPAEDGRTWLTQQKNNKITQVLLTRAVAELFIPNPNNLPVVMTRTGDRSDAHITNLEWVTRSDARRRFPRSRLDDLLNGYPANCASSARAYGERNLGLMMCPHYFILADGTIYTYIYTDKKTLRTEITNTGYKQVILFRFDGMRMAKYVHRLVALAFLDTPEDPKKVHVNHKDGNKLNNHHTNLEWCTPQENLNHYLDILDGGRTISKEMAHSICELIVSGVHRTVIAKELGVDIWNVDFIRLKRTHTDISYLYSI